MKRFTIVSFLMPLFFFSLLPAQEISPVTTTHRNVNVDSKSIIRGTVYDDFNQNGTFDTGEPGIGDMHILLSGAATSAQYSASNGVYVFQNLPQGDYTLSIEGKSPWSLVEPLSGHWALTITGDSEIVSGRNFGFNFQSNRVKVNLKLRSESGQKFPASGSELFFGVRSGASGGISSNSVDIDEGESECPPYPPLGVFDARFVQPTPFSPGDFGQGSHIDMRDYVASDQSDTFKIRFQIYQNEYTVLYWDKSSLSSQYGGNVWLMYETLTLNMKTNDSLLLSGEDNFFRIITNTPFPKLKLGRIEGMAYLDINSNGIREADEPPLKEWKIILSGDNTDTTLTDENGIYRFTQLESGIYHVTEELPSGWQITEPKPSSQWDVTLATNLDVAENLNFGNFAALKISGTVYEDEGSNCVNGAGLPNRYIKLEPGPFYATTKSDGGYTFFVTPGTYTVSLMPQNNWEQTCPESVGTYTVTIVTPQEISGFDFGCRNTSVVKDLSLWIYPSFPFPLASPCCGQQMTYNCFFANYGTVPVSGASIRIVLSEAVSYESFGSYPYTLEPPSNVGSNTYVCQLPATLLPGEYGMVALTVRVHCSFPTSQLLATNAEIYPIAGDTYPPNNVSTSIRQVACSYDPNDKAVSPAGCGIDGYITHDDSLTYTIRFQNYGNAAAHLVVVKDTLDTDVDISSVQVLPSSHSNIFEIHGRELVWTFWGIVLPPAEEDEAGSQGFVKFTVKQAANRPEGTVIKNRAGIYFDLNEVVMTNTTTNTVTANPLPVSEFVLTKDTLTIGETIDATYTGGTSGATYAWDFGIDANPGSTTVENPSGISYSTPGEKIIYLNVNNGSCSAEPFVKTVHVIDTTWKEISIAMNPRWNLVSVPLQVTDYSTQSVFPGHLTRAFSFQTTGGYVGFDTLSPGIGYWVKFTTGLPCLVAGRKFTSDTIHVDEGWNIIGSISTDVPVAELTSDPPGLTTSQFFGYSGKYVATDVIKSGRAYWVKASESGNLILSSMITSLSKRISIVPTTELPPMPPDVSGSENPVDLPERFKVQQNYPNPFNPTTSIHYQLPEDSYVTLQIYNILGEEVGKIVDEFQTSGFKSVLWDASGLPSGVYMYRITAGKYSDVKKMMIMR